MCEIDGAHDYVPWCSGTGCNIVVTWQCTVCCFSTLWEVAVCVDALRDVAVHGDVWHRVTLQHAKTDGVAASLTETRKSPRITSAMAYCMLLTSKSYWHPLEKKILQAIRHNFHCSFTARPVSTSHVVILHHAHFLAPLSHLLPPFISFPFCNLPSPAQLYLLWKQVWPIQKEQGDSSAGHHWDSKSKCLCRLPCCGKCFAVGLFIYFPSGNVVHWGNEWIGVLIRAQRMT